MSRTITVIRDPEGRETTIVSKSTGCFGSGCGWIAFLLAVAFVVGAPGQWPLALAIPAWIMEFLIALGVIVAFATNPGYRDRVLRRR